MAAVGHGHDMQVVTCLFICKQSLACQEATGSDFLVNRSSTADDRSWSWRATMKARPQGGALVEQLGHAPVTLGRIAEGGQLVQVRDGRSSNGVATLAAIKRWSSSRGGVSEHDRRGASERRRRRRLRPAAA